MKSIMKIHTVKHPVYGRVAKIWVSGSETLQELRELEYEILSEMNLLNEWKCEYAKPVIEVWE